MAPKQSPLHYRSGGDDAPRPGPTVAARVAAGVCSPLFILLGLWAWFTIDRGQPTTRTLLQPGIVLCCIAVVLCGLVAAGAFGKGRRPP